MRAIVKGTVMNVVDKTSSKGKIYQQFQILQASKEGMADLVTGRLWDGRVLERGKPIELEGIVRVFKFKDGNPGLSFDVF